MTLPDSPSYPLPAMKAPFDALARKLRDMNGDRTLLFVVNHGNWGDALIREGAEAFLKHYRFNYVSVDSNKLMDGKITGEDSKRLTGEEDPLMVYNGSGALMSRYGRVEKMAKLSHEYSASLLFPSTFAVKYSDYNFSPEMAVFSRGLAASMENCPDAEFCHDMAFFYTPPRFPKPNRKWGLFLRDDDESPDGMVIPEGYGNHDISKDGRAKTPIYKFMKTLAKYERIYTNRLHVAIGGALLGRQVFVSSNDYFKIEEIYAASIKDYFPNVSFAKEFDLDALGLTRPSFLQKHIPALRR